MPIYEYICQECHHAFDAMQRISDAPLTTCPACQADSLIKCISAPAFQLKGSGWYATDFKSKPKTAVDSDAPVTAEAPVKKTTDGEVA